MVHFKHIIITLMGGGGGGEAKVFQLITVFIKAGG